MRVQRSVLWGFLCALSPFAVESVCSARHARRDDTESDEGNVPVVYVVVYVVLASDPRAKDLSACERESKTQEKESLSRLFSRSSRVALRPSLFPSFASPAIRCLRELLLLLPRASRPGHEPVPFVFFFFR